MTPVSSSAPDVATAVNQFRSHSDAADGIAGAGRWEDLDATKVEVHLPGPQIVLHPHSTGSSDEIRVITREARGSSSGTGENWEWVSGEPATLLAEATAIPNSAPMNGLAVLWPHYVSHHAFKDR